MRRVLALLLSLCACVDRGVELDSGVDPETGDAATDPTGPTSGAPDPTEGAHGNPDGPCQPTRGDADCAFDYVCCSDDPATTLGRLPNYFFPDKLDDKYGTPIFSANNDSLSASGQCVKLGFPTPLANGCPVPCNPTWEAARQTELCGTAVCCPFTQVDPDKDCVVDPDTGKWRAVRGTDIGTLSVWGLQHTTNQDPTGASCKLFASGGIEGAPPDMAVLADCYDQLSVADQRGFCFAAAACPCTEDLCDQKNPGWVPRC